MQKIEHTLREPRASFRYHQIRARLGRGDLHPGSAPATSGTTISDFDRLEQAMWPGNSSTSSTITVICRLAAAPHKIAERDLLLRDVIDQPDAGDPDVNDLDVLVG